MIKDRLGTIGLLDKLDLKQLENPFSSRRSVIIFKSSNIKDFKSSEQIPLIFGDTQHFMQGFGRSIEINPSFENFTEDQMKAAIQAAVSVDLREYEKGVKLSINLNDIKTTTKVCILISQLLK